MSSVAASNVPEPVECTACRELVVPPELPVASWHRTVAREPGTPRPDPDHLEHFRCNRKRVPRTTATRPAEAARGA